MDARELKKEEAVNKEYLDSLLDVYRSAERKSKKLFECIVIICVIALYFMLSFFLGYKWGFILTIAILMAGGYCVSTLEISFKNNTISDGKLAHEVCVTMECLVAIKQGTYRQYGAQIIYSGTGKHYDLYKQFTQLYPEYKCKELKQLAKTEVQHDDIFN